MKILASVLSMALFCFALSTSVAAQAPSDGVSTSFAFTFSLGGGCGNPVPTCSATNPVLGSSMTISGTQAPSTAYGAVALSLPISAITANLGGPNFDQPCSFFLQTNAFVVLSDLTPDAMGNWMYSGFVPNVPSAAGVQFNVQALFISAAEGLTATNGVRLVLGF